MTHNETRRLTTADRAAIVVALLLPTAVTWLYFIALDGAPRSLQQGAYAAGKTIQFALPIFWVWLIRRQRPNIQPPGRRGLAAGALFGLAVSAAMTALYVAVLKPGGMFAGPSAAVREKVEAFGAGSPAGFLVLALFYSAIHSLLEEYYWRWFVFAQLARVCKLPTAIAISSVAFAVHHILVLGHYFGRTSPWTWLFATGVIIGGGFWAWLYHRSGSLYATWLSHGIIDASIFAIGYDVIAS